MSHEAELVRNVISKLRHLEDEVVQLRAYKEHTERMLALAELGQTRGYEMGCHDDNTFNRLEQLAKSLEVESALGDPAVHPGDGAQMESAFSQPLNVRTP